MFGRGLKWKDISIHGLIFSERNGYSKVQQIHEGAEQSDIGFSNGVGDLLSPLPYYHQLKTNQAKLIFKHNERTGCSYAMPILF